jgi:O-antigen ligase
MASITRLISRHIAEDAHRWGRGIDAFGSFFGANLLRDACLTTLFVIAPVVLIYSSRALPAIVVAALTFAVLYTIAAAATDGGPSLGRKIANGLDPRTVPWWVWCTLALLFYSGVSSLWALDSDMAQEQSIKMAFMLLAILALQRLSPPLIRKAHRVGAAVGIALAAVILIIELKSPGIFRTYIYGPNPAYLNRSVVSVSLLMWPTLALTTGRYRHWIRSGLILLVAAAVIVSRSDSALLAIAAGLLVTSMALVSNRLAAIGVIVVGTAAFIAMPMTVQVMADIASETGVESMVNLSTERRLEFWEAFSDVALQRPILGWGLESSRFFGIWDLPGVTWTIGPVHHPHNPILQIWVELGAIGVALAGLIMIGIVLSVARLPGRRRSFAYGAITATLAISSVSHGAWQLWWICLLMLVTALFTFKERYPDDTPEQI